MSQISIHPAVDNGVKAGVTKFFGRHASLQVCERSGRGNHHRAVSP